MWVNLENIMEGEGSQPQKATYYDSIYMKYPGEGNLQKRKTSTSPLLAMPMPLTVWTTTNSGKFLKR